MVAVERVMRQRELCLTFIRNSATIKQAQPGYVYSILRLVLLAADESEFWHDGPMYTVCATREVRTL
jgi:hypothetical protein